MLSPVGCQGCVPLSFWNRDRSITSLHNFTQHHHFPPHSLQFSPYTLMPSFTGLTHYCHQMILRLSNERGLNTVAGNVFHCLHIAWKISHSSPPGLQSFTHVSAFLYPAVYPAVASATIQRDSQPLCRLCVCLIPATTMCTCGLPSLGTKSSHEGLPV